MEFSSGADIAITIVGCEGDKSLGGFDDLGIFQSGMPDSDQVSGGGNKDNFEDVVIIWGAEDGPTGGVRVSANIILWGKEDVDKYGFGVGFPHDPLEDFLGLVDIEGGNLIRNSSVGLKFFFEGVV